MSENGSEWNLDKSFVIGDNVLSQFSQASGDGQQASGDDISHFASRTSHLLYDGHGSTRQLVGKVNDSSNYALTNLRISSYDYDAYGVELPNAQSLTPNAPATQLRYSGEYFDSDLNQQYLRARYYNQNNGQFNRLDPYAGRLNDPQSLHKYAYCHQDPVNGVDPSGEMSLVETNIVVSLLAGLTAGVMNFSISMLSGKSFQQSLVSAAKASLSAIFGTFLALSIGLGNPIVVSVIQGVFTAFIDELMYIYENPGKQIRGVRIFAAAVAGGLTGLVGNSFSVPISRSEDLSKVLYFIYETKQLVATNLTAFLVVTGQLFFDALAGE